MIRDAKEGEFVYIRAEFRHIGETGAAWVWIRDPKNHSLSCIPVPQSQVVCREPATDGRSRRPSSCGMLSGKQE
jgi:hypothetical protein